MNCPHCQSPAAPDSAFCSRCGNRLAAKAQPGGAACAVHPGTAAQQACPRCGTFVCARCLIVRPGAEVLCKACEAKFPGGLLPWDRRDELGMLKAWWQTCTKIISAPTVTFAWARPDAPLGSSFLFAALSNVAGMLTTALIYAVVIGIALGLAPAGGSWPFQGLGAAGLVGIAVGGFFGYLLLVALGGVMSLVIMSGVDHLCLRLVGANPGAWSVTVRAQALSLSPYLIGLIPICGLYVFPIWSLILKVFSYRAFHHTTGGKATAGALLPIGFLIAALAVGYALVIVAALSLAPERS